VNRCKLCADPIGGPPGTPCERCDGPKKLRADLKKASAGLAQARADACEQAEPRVRAEERERIARLFDEEAARAQDVAHEVALRGHMAAHSANSHAAHLLRSHAARIRASGETSGTAPTPVQPQEGAVARPPAGPDALFYSVGARDASSRGDGPKTPALSAEALPPDAACPDCGGYGLGPDVYHLSDGTVDQGRCEACDGTGRGDHVGAGKGGV